MFKEDDMGIIRSIGEDIRRNVQRSIREEIGDAVEDERKRGMSFLYICLKDAGVSEEAIKGYMMNCYDVNPSYVERIIKRTERELDRD